MTRTACRVARIEVDGQPVDVRLHGPAPVTMTVADYRHLVDVVRAARRKFTRNADRRPLACPCGRLRLPGSPCCGLHDRHAGVRAEPS